MTVSQSISLGRGNKAVIRDAVASLSGPNDKKLYFILSHTYLGRKKQQRSNFDRFLKHDIIHCYYKRSGTTIGEGRIWGQLQNSDDLYFFP